MADRAAAPFKAHYSVPKLIGKALIGGIMAALSLAVVMGSLGKTDLVTQLAGAAGVLFFGGTSAVFAVRLFDRREQVIINGSGLYIRAHGETRIALRSIERFGAHWDRLTLMLYKPSKYPIETRHRRLIYRLNGPFARGYFGDAWIYAGHLDQPVAAFIDAIRAHRPQTAFEQELGELSAAGDQQALGLAGG